MAALPVHSEGGGSQPWSADAALQAVSPQMAVSVQWLLVQHPRPAGQSVAASLQGTHDATLPLEYSAHSFWQ